MAGGGGGQKVFNLFGVQKIVTCEGGVKKFDGGKFSITQPPKGFLNTP